MLGFTTHDGVLLQHISHCIKLLEPREGVTPHNGVLLQQICHCIKMLEPHVGVTPHDGVLLQHICHCIKMLEPHVGVTPLYGVRPHDWLLALFCTSLLQFLPTCSLAYLLTWLHTYLLTGSLVTC